MILAATCLCPQLFPRIARVASILANVECRYELYQALEGAHARLAGRLEAALQRTMRLSLREQAVLEELSALGPRRMNELADSLAISPSGLSRLADRLVEEGLVERLTCPSDRRGFFLSVTEAGGKKRVQARERIDAVLKELLGNTDRTDLSTALAKLP